VPGWHDDTRALQEAGSLQMIGIIQEQHPDRCRLFMQWKQMDWPILVDSLNLYAIDVVPATYAIDEFGVVRYVNPSREQFAKFMATRYVAPADSAPARVTRPDLRSLERGARTARSATAWTAFGDALFLWGGETRLNDVVDAYERAARIEPEAGPVHFRLGTALRRRDETSRRRAEDFRRAVDHWARALDINPNQYIWRRRLQQYGPREEKPYPFYDWIDEARRDIRTRGFAGRANWRRNRTADPHVRRVGGADRSARPARSHHPRQRSSRSQRVSSRAAACKGRRNHAGAPGVSSQRRGEGALEQ
jgi:tetratricopeptide (TPR) repeat protein